MQKSWLEDIWNSFLIFFLFESLLVPWGQLHDRGGSVFRRRTTDRNGDGIALSPSGDSYLDGRTHQINRKTQGLSFSPWWRETALNRIVRALHPVDGLRAYVLDDVQIRPGPSAAWNSPVLTVPSHPEGAYGPGIQEESVNPDLSLEDSELIDVLWRADIDIEKGLAAVLPSPEQQHERDLELLSEKHWTRQISSVPWRNEQQNELFSSFSKAYSDLRNDQKEFAARDPFAEWRQMKGDERLRSSSVDPFQEKDEKETLDATKFLENFNDPEKENVAGCAFGESSGVFSEDAFDEFFRSVNDEDWNQPVNDVCLASAAVPDDLSPDQEATRGAFGRADPLLTEGWRDTSLMEWDRGNHVTPIAELDSIQTPDLEMTVNDVNRLFADRQVNQDLIASVQPEITGGDGMSSVSGGASFTANRRMRAGSNLSDQRVPDGSNRSPTFGSFSPEDGLELFLEPLAPLDEFDVLLPNKELPISSPNPSPLPSPNRGSDLSQSTSNSYTNHVGHDHMYGMTEMESAHFNAEREEDGGREDGSGDYSSTRIHGKLVPLVDDIKDEEGDVRDTRKPQTKSRMKQTSPSASRPGRQSQDEQLARRYGLMYSAEEIVDMPLTRFIQLLRSGSLSYEQQQVMQKIRRRGKNKEAARNCRKRKVTDLEQLETETELLRQEKDVETQTNYKLQDEIVQEEAEIQRLERELNNFGSI